MCINGTNMLTLISQISRAVLGSGFAWLWFVIMTQCIISIIITSLTFLLHTRLHEPHGCCGQKHDPDIILETCPFGWKEGCELWTCSFSIATAHLGYYCKTCCMKYSEFSESWSDAPERGFFPGCSPWDWGANPADLVSGWPDYPHGTVKHAGLI